MFVYFEVHGDVLINRQMMRMAEFAGDAAPAFEAIGERMFEIEKKQFDSEGVRGGGEKWTALADSTKARKEREGLDPRILHATLDLEKSLTQRGGDNRFIVTHNMLVFGSELPYAAPHQNPKPGSKLPRRRPIDFREGDKATFVKVLQEWIMVGSVVLTSASRMSSGMIERRLNTEMGQAIL